MINVLELFAGSRSVGKAAEDLGYNVFSCDIEPFDNINYISNILEFDYSQVPFVPDIICASPPCEKWSLACGVEGGNIYWESIKEKGKTIGIKPRENFNVNAKYLILKDPSKVKSERDLSISLLNKTLEIITHYNPKVYFIENPFGYMRFYLNDKVNYINFTTYCQYGFPYRKPTNIFSNIKLNLKSCDIGSDCHSNNLYTRGKINKLREISIVKNYYERSKIPHNLCIEILKQAVNYINLNIKNSDTICFDNIKKDNYVQTNLFQY
jgi:site-specific DNA-cytosine methylase